MNCINSSDITLENSGGICGSLSGIYNGEVTITNCNNLSNILGKSCGGICGSGCGIKGIMNLIKCFNVGNIGTTQDNYRIGQGGICGSQFSGTSTVNYCYNIGNINGIRCSGLFGNIFGYNVPGINFNIEINNCYTVGNIVTSYLGSGGNTDTLNGGFLSTIYPKSLGNISTLKIYNSYILNGPLSYSNIRPSLISNIDLSNIYIANSTWNDTSANEILKPDTIPTPTNNYIGTIWSRFNNNTPYILSGYNSNIYDASYGSYQIVGNVAQKSTKTGLFGPDYSYNILNITKDYIAFTNSQNSITINNSNGIITFSNVTDNDSLYNVNVIVSKYINSNNMNIPYDYNINTYTIFIKNPMFPNCFA
jgi:hypothetical protein